MLLAMGRQRQWGSSSREPAQRSAQGFEEIVFTACGLLGMNDPRLVYGRSTYLLLRRGPDFSFEQRQVNRLPRLGRTAQCFENAHVRPSFRPRRLWLLVFKHTS